MDRETDNGTTAREMGSGTTDSGTTREMESGTTRETDSGTTGSGTTKVNKATVNGIIKITAGGLMEGGTMGDFNAALGEE